VRTQGPIPQADVIEQAGATIRRKRRRPVDMGPGVRRDDAERV
jgi:hypothetical protein